MYAIVNDHLTAALKFSEALSPRTKVSISSGLTIAVGLYVLWHM
jgi:hypothetical protein